jgi:hypothetical protein
MVEAALKADLAHLEVEDEVAEDSRVADRLDSPCNACRASLR